MANDLIKDVSDTAYWIAGYRAIESKRADALFHDPLADHLAGERGRELARKMPMSKMVGWTVAVRTRIIDGYIAAAIEGGVDLVLNLGAGLDTRPFRLILPSAMTWMEADYPHVIEYKNIRLRGKVAHCRLERFKADLSDIPARREFLGNIDARFKKILILTEGVVPYLTVEEAASLAADLRKMKNTRYWVVDYLSKDTMRYRQRSGLDDAMRNAPFKFWPDDWFAFFESHGWRVAAIRYFAEEGGRLGRPCPIPILMKIFLKVLSPFTSAQRRDSWQRFAGYVLLEQG